VLKGPGLVTIQLAAGIVKVVGDQDVSLNVGRNFELKAGGNVTIKASGTADLEASGQMTIKGSPVAIN
jgi:hypothetical protein